MPELSGLADEGVLFKDSRTVFPSDTCPAHVSLLTGCYPEKNGFSFGFYRDPQTGEYAVGQLRPFEESIWKRSVLGAATREGLRCVSISVPGLNESLPSFLVEGGETKGLGHKEFKRGETGSWVLNAALYSMGNLKFDMLIFTDFLLDEVQHRYGCHTRQTIEACGKLDGWVSVLLKRMRKDTNVIVVSDHGQTNIENTVNLKLAFEGLRIDALDSDGRAAYVKVDSESKDEVMGRIESLDGIGRVLDSREISRRRALFEPHRVNGIWIYPPDLVIEAKEDWSFDHQGPLYWRRLRGDHGGTRDKEIHNTLIMKCPDFKKGERIEEPVSITDLAPTIAAMLGIPMETQGEPLNKVCKSSPKE